jgi:epoxyqueuosine reductase
MVDANRCIAYLTIEHKGFIPLDMRPQLGTWIFGCDVCQQVCPWNKKTSELNPESLEDVIYDDLFTPLPGLPPESLSAELVLTPQEFNRKFKGSPIKRTKRRGYLRNAAIALGNLRDMSAVPALIHALGDSEPMVRGHAAWALGQIGGDESAKGLRQALLVEGDPAVRLEIQGALANLTT